MPKPAKRTLSDLSALAPTPAAPPIELAEALEAAAVARSAELVLAHTDVHLDLTQVNPSALGPHEPGTDPSVSTENGPEAPPAGTEEPHPDLVPSVEVRELTEEQVKELLVEIEQESSPTYDEPGADLEAVLRGFAVAVDLGVGRYSTKQVVYACFAGRATTGWSHKQVAWAARCWKPGSATTDKSVASMHVDYRNGGHASGSAAERPKGQVQAIVYALLEEGGMTSEAIAAEVRRRVPHAQTTGKSVASMKVDWKARGGVVRGPARVTATAEHFGASGHGS
jgi:hypothetical protein